MIIDALTQMCNDEAASGTAATRLEGSQIDLSVARDIGNGQPIYWHLVVVTAAASVGSATINVVLASDATAAVATDGSATVHAQTGILAYTAFTKGRRWVFPLPTEGNVYEKFLGTLVITADATTTALVIDSFLSPDPAGWKAYADADS
jgi:predicted RecA/RadA family phage recombinase